MSYWTFYVKSDVKNWYFRKDLIVKIHLKSPAIAFGMKLPLIDRELFGLPTYKISSLQLLWLLSYLTSKVEITAENIDIVEH